MHALILALHNLSYSLKAAGASHTVFVPWPSDNSIYVLSRSSSQSLESEKWDYQNCFILMGSENQPQKQKKSVSKVLSNHGPPLVAAPKKAQRMDSSHDPRTVSALQDSQPTPQQPGKVLPDPPGAKWFKKNLDGKGLQEQMFDYAKEHGHDFMVALDYLEQKPGIKMYASYPGCEDFLRNTLYKTEDRHFYELIPEGKPCKLYLDVEWEGPEDPEKRVIHH